MPCLPLRRHLATAALLLCGVATAHAGEVYGSFGVPGLMLGYAHPIAPHFGVRADYATLGTRTKQTEEEGIHYDAKLNTSRVGFFGDVYPFAGVFRITGGLTVNNYKMHLDGSGAGGSITVGDNTYPTTAADGIAVDIKFPRTTPYLGIGWGHQADSGWRAAFDIGAMFGKLKVTTTPRGVLASDAAKADVDKEVAQLTEKTDKVKFIPQITLSVGYSF
jgi:hypothetical protein